MRGITITCLLLVAATARADYVLDEEFAQQEGASLVVLAGLGSANGTVAVNSTGDVQWSEGFNVRTAYWDGTPSTPVPIPGTHSHRLATHT